MQPDEIGIGPTEALCLRVSVATLVRVTFSHPETGQTMLALERKASLEISHPTGVGNRAVHVVAQPFGGAVSILRPDTLMEEIGHFHYDSPRSKGEQDFRILIRPVDWVRVKQFCLDEFRAAILAQTIHAPILEVDPIRELAEEFEDSLHETLSPVQYQLTPLEFLVENVPVETGNLRAAHLPTVRLYVIFEALLRDPVLIGRMLANHADVSDQKLAELAEGDARKGGRGRANGVLTLPVEHLRLAYLDLPPEGRGAPFTFQFHRLEGNVAAVLDDLKVPRYERFTL